MDQFNIGATGVPGYGTMGTTRAQIEVAILQRLRQASQFTSTIARNMLQNPNYRISQAHKTFMLDAYRSWIKYWSWQSHYLNEIRRVELPPLPSTPRDELTKDGFRQEFECMSANIIGEVARMYFLAHWTEDQVSTWSLNDTREDFWVEQGYWTALEVNPQPLEQTPAALEKMRKDNEEEKRAKEKNGPGLNKKATANEAPPETPEERFNRAFQNLNMNQEIRERQAIASGMLWHRPVATFTQRNVYDAVMLLCEVVNDYPSGHPEVLRLIHELLCRLGCFFLQPAPPSLMDIPRYRIQIFEDLYTFNRAFKIWAGCYFYELLQRVQYASTIGSVPLPIPWTIDGYVTTLKKRVLDMCLEMGPIDFNKFYRLSTEEFYDFPGDYAFCKFLHPQGTVNRGDLLIELHGDRQAPRFFSEAKVQTETILHNMMQVKTHLARICVLNALDRYFFMDGVRWRDGAVVDQRGLQLSDTKLTDSTIPCLVAPMSDYIAHYELKAYRGETLFHVIVVWLLLIRHYKQGFFYRTDITKQINFLLGEEEAVAVVGTRPAAPPDDYAEVEPILSGNNAFVTKRL
jgi:hypothetical protein